MARWYEFRSLTSASPDYKTTSVSLDESEDPFDLRVLFIGNSHSAPIPKLLREIFKRQLPDKKVQLQRVTSFGFLIDHAQRPSTLKHLKSTKWDYVVLQAQKYSTSGKYRYPTRGAAALADIATKNGAKVIMYPEWSRRGVPEEYARIRKLHDAIATETGAVVAPIGEAWELAFANNDQLKLHAADGNHASGLGSYLNACVFFTLLTGESAERLGVEKESKRNQQRRLVEQAAANAVANNSKQKSDGTSNQHDPPK